MELSRLTKLLLWLLSKRPDIGNLAIHEATPMGSSLDPDLTEDELYDYDSIAPEFQREFDIEFLTDCWNKPSS